MKISNSARNSVLVVAAALGLSACASGPQPSAQMSAARSAVSQAGTMSIGPEGSVELQKAQAKLALADQALKEQNWERAKRFAEQAEVDAKLAMAWAEAEKGKVTAAQAQEQIVADMRQANAVSQTAPAATSSTNQAQPASAGTAQ